MNFTEEQLEALNTYLNECEDLPVEVDAINVALREHFEQDNSELSPEVEAALPDDVAAAVADQNAPVEETVAEVPTEPES